MLGVSFFLLKKISHAHQAFDQKYVYVYSNIVKYGYNLK